MLNRRQAIFSGVACVMDASAPGATTTSPLTVPSAGPFTVRAEEGHVGSPWIIAGHYPVMSKIAGVDTGGRYSIIKLIQPPNTGPALHIHPEQNEWFFVIRGSIGVRLGEERIVLKAGDSLMAPKAVPHAYVTLGVEDAHLLFLYDPAGDMDGYFKALSQIKRLADGHADPEARTKAFSDHGMKMVGPPPQASEFAA